MADNGLQRVPLVDQLPREPALTQPGSLVIDRAAITQVLSDTFTNTRRFRRGGKLRTRFLGSVVVPYHLLIRSYLPLHFRLFLAASNA